MSQWYRGQYGNLLKEDKAAFGELFGQLDGVRKAPRKPSIVHFYSGRWYESRIKRRVKERLATVRKRATYTGQKVHTITVQNEVTQECWDDETEEFKAEMVRQRDVEHEITLKAWRESAADSPSRTPEEYNA
jgi:lipocalin